MCVLSNGLNHEDWPRVVSDDIHRHLEKLRSRVVTLRGHAEGRTLLPLPLCVERVRPKEIELRWVCIHGCRSMCACVLSLCVVSK